MKRNSSLVLIGSLTLVVGLAYYFGLRQVNSEIEFEDLEVGQNEGAVEASFGGYITLPAISAEEDAVLNLIGAVLVRSRVEGEEAWTYDYRFRPARDRVKTKFVDEQHFEGIVSVKADFGGRFSLVSGGASSNDLAETTIANKLIAGFVDNSDIPFQELSRIKLKPGRDYYFVESVVVTEVSTRRFHEHSGEGKIEGLAFGANGSVYSQRGATSNRRFVSFRPMNLLGLQSSEAGGNSTLRALASSARQGSLEAWDAPKLVELLIERTQGHPISAPSVGAPSAGLPSSLRGMGQLVWHDSLRPARQSTPNMCWAATTALLMSWKKGRTIDEAEAIVGLGPEWEEFYLRDEPLPSDYKLPLIRGADFAFKAPQSYTPQGLVSLLKTHGPIWFTIDREFGRHATVLTGVFLDEAKGEYWVSYIDPADGLLKADTYNDFSRRYEAPAARERDEGNPVPETLEELDIQIVHLR